MAVVSGAVVSVAAVSAVVVFVAGVAAEVGEDGAPAWAWV